MDSNEVQPNSKNNSKVKIPTLYRVVFYNDDFTPETFVNKILSVIFKKSAEESCSLIKEIQTNGSATIGIYPHEIAQTKQAQTIYNAKRNGYPLYCETESNS